MAGHYNAVVGVAVALALAYLVLQVVALKQLTSPRMETAAKYAGLILIAAFCLIDWALGLTGWVFLEAVILIVGLPIAVIHLAILLVQESRQG
jgi:hypothetical protein